MADPGTAHRVGAAAEEPEEVARIGEVRHEVDPRHGRARELISQDA